MWFPILEISRIERCKQFSRPNLDVTYMAVEG
jgi:hypothetical protein